MSEIATSKIDLPEVEDKQEVKKSRVKKLFDILLIISVVTVLIFSGLQLFVNLNYTQVYIDGISMAPTLNDSKRFNSSTPYNFQEFGLMDARSSAINKIKRNDIVIFHPKLPTDVNYNENNYYIKRVIGLPNETISINKNEAIVSINIVTTKGVSFVLDQDYLANDVLLATYSGKYAVNSSLTLKEDEYYVLGDNRGHSIDSRDERLGPVKKSQITGVLKVIQGYEEFEYLPDGSIKSVKKKKYNIFDWRYY